jgi:hypothetical protein
MPVRGRVAAEAGSAVVEAVAPVVVGLVVAGEAVVAGVEVVALELVDVPELAGATGAGDVVVADGADVVGGGCEWVVGELW